MAPSEAARDVLPPGVGRRRRTPSRICDDARQRKLLRAARRGDRGARARLVEHHLPTVRAVASRYRHCGLGADDLVQEGCIGLLDAIDRYDADRGAPFDAYARFRVRRAIRNALTDQARLIRLPRQVVERRRALDRAEARLLAAGHRPTPAELAAATGIPLTAVLEARAAPQPPISLDKALPPDGSSLGTLVADPAARDPAADVLAHETGRLLERALGHLPERQRQIVNAQWGLNGAAERSAAELGRELHLSPRRVQTIARDAVRALRQALDGAEVTP